MKYHFIAIGGAAMHNLAIALKLAGHEVTGSDDEIFEPSKARLQRFGLLPAYSGWFPERITAKLDGVILGMHARIDNPELSRVTELGIPVYSYPEFLFEQYKEKNRIVVAGSHGKTTITAMILHVLHQLGQEPDYMVGAQLEGFDVMVRITKGEGNAVLEGDEYLTSPIDRRPKFLHYQPHIALISGIAWDHMNVFPTFQDYLNQFSLLIRSLPQGGTLIYCKDDSVLYDLVVKEIPEGVQSISYSLPAYHIQDGISYLHNREGILPLQVFGKHNLMNMMGAACVCQQLGLERDAVLGALSGFPGASRRLENLFSTDSVGVYRDFAHAPSKLKATINAVKEQFPHRKLVACMELHTFSSLNSAFLPQYEGSMQEADVAIVFYHPETLVKKNLPILSLEQVREAFGRDDLMVFHDVGQLEQFVMGLKLEDLNLLLMSSGDFHGLDIGKLIASLQHAYEK